MLQDTASLQINKEEYLKSKHPLDFEGKIRFHDVGHKYELRSSYLEDWVTNEVGCGSAPIVSTTTILKGFFFDSFSMLAAKLWNNQGNRIRMANDPTYKYFGCKSVDDIRAVWNKGAEAGTLMHNRFESYCNHLQYALDHPEQGVTLDDICHRATQLGCEEARYFRQFVKQFRLDDPDGDYELLRTEVLLFHDVLHISGAADLLLRDKRDDSLVICDWKRVKGSVQGDPKNPRKPVHLLSERSRGLILPAMMQLRNNSFNKYGLQQTMYRNLVQRLTGKVVSAMYLVVIDSLKIGNPDALKVMPIPLDKFQPAIDQVFQWRANEILTTHHDTLPDDLFTALLKYIPPRVPLDDSPTPPSTPSSTGSKRSVDDDMIDSDPKRLRS